MDVSALEGRVLTQVLAVVGGDEMVLRCLDGAAFRFFHSQDCSTINDSFREATREEVERWLGAEAAVP